MIGYAFDSIGFGMGDLLLIAFSILVGVWAVTTLKHDKRSRTITLVTVGLGLLALVPLVLFGLAFVALNDNAPAANETQQAAGLQSQAVNMGPIINTRLREAEPSFTADGRTMYFNCKSADICVSHLNGTWEEGNWTPPERLRAHINTGYQEVEPLINAAGDKLYFTSNRPSGRLKENLFLSPLVTNGFGVVNYLLMKLDFTVLGGLGFPHVWVSYKKDGVWSDPQNLNDVASEPPVNTGFADHCPFFSADGNEIFWTSIRPGGYGNNDIWTSRRVNGRWTKPENLGPNVNGPASEHHSIPAPDGRSLYVMSNRPGGFGGDDIYLTTRGDDGKWGPLVNQGPLINGPEDDRCPTLTTDGRIFVFDSNRAGGYGSRDLWWVYFKDVTIAETKKPE